MKKVLLFLLIFFLNPSFIFALNLDVKSNLESGEYNFPIEINLISNDKEAKIFYYTDGEGRMDNIKEFKKPILLKEDTTIDFYATSKNYEDTLIKTSIFTFKYSNKIDIIGKDNEIIIKNNSKDIQNIGYWIIETDNLSYEIKPNTFLEINETFKLDYNLKNNEKISLISPDKKIIKNFTYKEEVKIHSIEEKTNNLVNEVKENSSGEILKTQEIKTGDIKKEENKEINIETGKTDEIKTNTDLNNSLKTSIIDTSTPNKNKKNNNLYIILGIFFVFVIYNIGLLLKKSEKFKNKFIKNNK